jgi:hypothetical protein
MTEITSSAVRQLSSAGFAKGGTQQEDGDPGQQRNGHNDQPESVEQLKDDNQWQDGQNHQLQ